VIAVIDAVDESSFSVCRRSVSVKRCVQSKAQKKRVHQEYHTQWFGEIHQNEAKNAS
jgi:hypothetical protein